MRREPATPRRDGGARLGAELLVVAGIVTFVNNYLPDSGHLDVALLNAASFLAVAVGLVAWFLPWYRWSARAPLLLVLFAFALIGTADRYGGVSSFSYAVYFVVVFVWVGLSQPPFTSMVLAPVAVAAYVWPLLTAPVPAPHGVASVTVAIPVCVLVGEALSRSVRRQLETQRQLQQRVALLEQQRNREQAIIDAVADGRLVVDDTGRVLSCNGAATKLLRMPADALVGRPVPVPVANSGLPVEHELGDRRWLESISATLPGTSESVVALHDISRQKALKEAQDLFLATSSHELRTPLTVVKGYLATLQRRWDVLTEEQRLEAIDTASERTDALVVLVNHLLLAARAGVGRHTVTARPFDLAAAARRIVGDFATMSARHRIDVVVDRGVPAALGESATIEPILGQLLENAVKYSPAGGSIVVSVRAEVGSVCVEVADEGVGLAAGSAAHLFAPFVQGASEDRREYGGVGLGLHIVRQLVEGQGGTVRAANRPGGGAVFTVALPAADRPAHPEG